MSEEQQQEKSIQDKYSFSSFPMYEHKTPDFREKKGYEYVRYGEDNTYPDYLVYLYNRSSIHNAIVNGKSRFILGQGWAMAQASGESILNDAIRRINAVETIDELTYKVILDRLIFGGYALRINWMGGKISSIYHQPFQEVRTNTKLSEFLVSKEWTREQSTKATFKSSAKVPEDVTFYQPFNPNTKETTTQILYVTDYRPQIKIYPLPEYIACNAYIETDIEISNFHLNNIKTGFAAGTMVTFFNGKPAPEEKKELERDLKSKVSGTDNAGEILINFAEANETKPEILPLRSNELDKQYEQLGRDTAQNIFIGHGVTSPMLFGVKSEGQLGGRSELDIAWQLFSLNYVEPRRKQFESEFNYLLQFTSVPNVKLELKPLQGLPAELTEQTIVNALSKDEIREMVAKQVGIDTQKQLRADDTLTTLNSMSPIVANKILNSLTTNQILALVGLPPVAGGDAIPVEPTAPDTTQLSKDKLNDFDSILINKFSQLGMSSEGLEFAEALTEDEQKLVDYIGDKKKIDTTKASKDLKIDATKVLSRLIEKGIVQSVTLPDGQVEIKEVQPPDNGFDVVTMWRYEGPKDSKNRGFCKQMLDMNLLYTKEQIDNLANDPVIKKFIDEGTYINSDVDLWRYRGGWYHDPVRNVNVPQCRHWWEQVLVKRRK